MNIITLQLVLLAFALLMIYSLFLHWKKKNVSNKFFFSWLVIFGVFIFLSMFPKVLEPLMKELFIIRVMDLGMMGTFMILTYVTIESNIKIKNLESKMERLTRKMAVKDIKRKNE